ncbi:MAG: DNA (cytosine-5-)-methyltransferase [Flavobacterium sp.]|nr:DNA (cytosine-5-)-methyltransferase [Flavobacterium sp.]
MIKTGSDFSGVGAFDQALSRLGIKQDKQFACDMDYYARQTYLLNFGTEKDIELSKSKEHKYYADLVQSFVLGKRVSNKEDELLNEANEFAKKFSFYYPFNVYNRGISTEPLDFYVPTPPCQSFSLAGKRKGEDSTNGVLFYNSHEFITVNKPRYFIFENVKGLLSDDGGKTFQRWIDYLGGKTVNGNPVIFPHEKSVPYHVYYQVMNAKHYGVPQNRERIFIIGIRDDADNDFSFPKPFHLVKRLKDVLESEVDEKYFLSDKMMEGLIKSGDKSYINQDTQASKVFSEYGEAPNICAETHGYANGYVETKIGAIRGRNPENPLSRVSGLPTEQMLEINESGVSNALTTVQKDNVVIIPANNSKGYDIAEEEEDSINFSNPNSETRRGRVGHGVAQTLDTACNQGVLVGVTINDRIAGWHENENVIGAHRGDLKRSSVSEHIYHKEGGVCTTIQTAHVPKLIQQRIRRLTPKECFSLMDFNEDFKWDVSDSQAYKQAGNSIVVNCLVEIISKLKLQ